MKNEQIKAVKKKLMSLLQSESIPKSAAFANALAIAKQEVLDWNIINRAGYELTPENRLIVVKALDEIKMPGITLGDTLEKMINDHWVNKTREIKPLVDPKKNDFMVAKKKSDRRKQNPKSIVKVNKVASPKLEPVVIVKKRKII